MSTKIDKQDTLNIADGIAQVIQLVLARDPEKRKGFWIRNIIEEGLNDWISECETEDAQWQRYDEDGNPINV